MNDDVTVEDDAAHDPGEKTPPPPRGRKRWMPEAGIEVAATLRLLTRQPWLIGGRDDDAIAAVRRNLTAIRDALSRLGWVLVVERDLVRLRKSPPVRRHAWAADGPTPLQASWFFLLLAGAEAVPPRVGLAQFVISARSAAVEAAVPVTNDIGERRAIVAALKMLHVRGLVEHIDGEVDGYVHDENAPVLLAVNHARLAHVIANYAAFDPADDPAAWLAEVEREPDAARRMRRRLVDDAVVHAVDLDDAEADWLRRRVRGDDGVPLASAFGLHVERRAEGAAFVVPDDAFRHPYELGDKPFPGTRTVPHAALVLCEHAGTDGIPGREADGPGPGWRGLPETGIIEHLRATAARMATGKGGWARELAEDVPRLAVEVLGLLGGLDLVRVQNRDGEPYWWFSPATGRWQPAPEAVSR